MRKNGNRRKNTKLEQLLNLLFGHMPTVTFTAWKEKEDKPLLLPTLWRDALASAKKTMQSIQAIRGYETKHACCMVPGTLQKSEKCWRNNPPSTMHIGHTRKKDPAPAATKDVVRLSSSIAQHKSWPAKSLTMHPSQGKNRRENQEDGIESDKNNAVSKDKKRLGDPAVESESESEWILVHCREGQT